MGGKFLNNLNKNLIILGILLIITAIATVSYLGPIAGRIAILGFVLLILGVLFPRLKTTGKKQAEKLNYRETNSADNCMNCKYCYEKKLNEGFEDCKWFEIEIDENHICDLFEKPD